MAAYSLDRSATPLGDYLRRLKAKIGPQGAHTATAHKIAIIFYTMVKNQVEYDATMWEARDQQRRQRQTAKLKRQAERLGYQLTPKDEMQAA
jgi:transposase